MSFLVPRALFAAVLLIPAAAQPAVPGRVGRIQVSANGRFLEYTDRTPFFWQGDTAWRLFDRLTREEVTRYLDDRQAKGFNVIQAVALHARVLQPPYGAPLLDNDPLRPNVTPGSDPGKPGEYDYWDHVDWIVGQAAKRGIYIAMLPCWGNVVNTGMLNAETGPRYVRWLAQRYGSRPNIFWVLGGDTRGDRNGDVWRAMGRALKEADPVHLISYHPFGRTQSSQWFHNEPWLDFNMFQSGHRRYDQDTDPGAKGEDNWRYVAEEYALSPAKPTLDAEPSYENIPQGLHDTTQPYWSDAHVRRYAYWSVFAGACGHTYGDNAIQQMYQPGTAGAFGPRNYWFEAIHDPGSGQMQYLKRLMLSRPYFERVPAQDVLASPNGARYDYIAVTRGRGYLFAYTFTGAPIAIRLGILSGKRVHAWWYSPRDGTARDAGTFANTGTRTFSPPQHSEEERDWVLVIDDASQHYPAPGR
ncbi:MAG: glycoside hydrolase family 140 protein [Acidobacteria bacterium]|nr:glycoside hydrolase family 140 protein [Acidobacteriota bacterium]